jgi:hypothetical protein
LHLVLEVLVVLLVESRDSELDYEDDGAQYSHESSQKCIAYFGARHFVHKPTGWVAIKANYVP